MGVATGQSADLSAINPFQPFQSGTLQNTVIGNEIDVRYFEFRYKLVHNAAAEKLIGPIHLRVTLLKTPQCGHLHGHIAVHPRIINPQHIYWHGYYPTQQ